MIQTHAPVSQQTAAAGKGTLVSPGAAEWTWSQHVIAGGCLASGGDALPLPTQTRWRQEKENPKDSFQAPGGSQARSPSRGRFPRGSVLLPAVCRELRSTQTCVSPLHSSLRLSRKQSQDTGTSETATSVRKRRASGVKVTGRPVEPGRGVAPPPAAPHRAARTCAPAVTASALANRRSKNRRHRPKSALQGREKRLSPLPPAARSGYEETIGRRLGRRNLNVCMKQTHSLKHVAYLH